MKLAKRARLGNSIIALFRTVAIGITLFYANVAMSQSSTNAQAYSSAPADHLFVSKGGVDLRSGTYDFSQDDLIIGNVTNGLKLTRTLQGSAQQHILPFGNFTHNWDIYIVEKRVDITKGNYNSGAGLDYRIIAYLDGASKTFDSKASETSFQGLSKNEISWLTYTGDRSSGTAIYTLRKTDGTLITFRSINSGDCATYLRCSFVSQITQPDGTTLKFEYDQSPGGSLNSGRLRSIVSNRGYAIVMEYAGMLVSKSCIINTSIQAKPSNNVCSSNTISITYGYASSSPFLLSSVTESSGKIWKYVYGGSGSSKTIGFIKPISETPFLINTYGDFISEDDVHSIVYFQQFADGHSYSYDYTDSGALTNGTINQIAGGTVTDNLGHSISVQYGFPLFPRELTPGYNSGDEENLPPPGDPGDHSNSGFTRIYQITPGPISVTDELGRKTTFEYCDPVIAAGLPASATDRCVVLRLQFFIDPEGMKTDVTFGPNGLATHVVRHPKPGSALTDISVSTVYDCTTSPNQCAKPVYTVDANGNVDYFNYTSFGEVDWAITPPATNGGARGLKLYSYAQKYAYLSGAAGSLIPAESPVWVPVSETTCQTIAGTGTGRPTTTPVCDATSPIITTQFEYGPDGTPGNLLLRGVARTAGGVTRRTCYGYDAQVNRIYETMPTAGLATCS